MLARQAARIVARRRCPSPYTPLRTFLEPANPPSITAKPASETTKSSSSSSTGSVLKAAGTTQQAVPSTDTIATIPASNENPLAASSNAGLGATIAMPAPSSSSSRTPTAAHRKLLQQQEKRERNAASKAAKDGLAQSSGVESSVDSAFKPEKQDKGKGRATEEVPMEMSMSPGQSFTATSGAENMRSFAEYASRSTPVSNSLLVARPDDPPMASGSGSQTPSHAGEITIASASPYTYSSSSSSSSSSPGSSSSSSDDGGQSSSQQNSLGFLPFIPLKNVPIPQIRHPFNTHRFVARLERDGVFNRDAAEEIMRTTKALLVMAEQEASRDLVAKADVENEAYLFSAALSELRTEVQMTARTDAIALRSLASQLQRETDSLGQKMREEMNNLKNDNQLDMNNRKDESSADIAAIEQKILDLSNKFSLLVGDTKAALETSKWIQTRRSIVMIAAFAIIAMAYMSSKPAPPPPAPPKPPSAEELGLKQIEEPVDFPESGLFGWLGGSQSGAKDVKKDTTKEMKDTAPTVRTV